MNDESSKYRAVFEAQGREAKMVASGVNTKPLPVPNVKPNPPPAPPRRGHAVQEATQPKPEQAVGDGVLYRFLGEGADSTIWREGSPLMSEAELAKRGIRVQRAYIEGTPRPAVATPAEVTDDSLDAENNDLSADNYRLHSRVGELEAELERLTAIAQPRTVGVPDGWKLVPLKSTDAMHRAYTRKKYQECDAESPLLIPELWEAMLAAAPEVPRA